MAKFIAGGGGPGGWSGARRKGAGPIGGRRSSSRKSVRHHGRLQGPEMLTTALEGDVSPASPDQPTESRRDENSSCSRAAPKRYDGGAQQISGLKTPPVGDGIAMERLLGEGSSASVLPCQIAASSPTELDGEGRKNSGGHVADIGALLQQAVLDREVIASMELLFRHIKEGREIINRNTNMHIHLLEEKVRYLMEELQVARVSIELLCTPIDRN